MHRRQFLRLTAAAPTLGAVPASRFDRDLIAAPDDPVEWPRFRAELTAWRTEARRTLAYDDALYRQPEFAWVSKVFSCCFVMLCDEAFYDPGESRYRLTEFLTHGAKEFGGYDALVLWHAYPRIGLDDRNQFDFYRDMPGGLPGLRRLVADCHRRGVKVFVDYNPWDTGTRREGAADLEAIAGIVGALNADGIFLDTMNKGAAEFRARLDSIRPGVVLEGEGALPLANVRDHHMSWAQWFYDSRVPGILRNKWFERRHRQHQVARWDRDHTGELHTAWMNGSGIMVWENVFGSWVGWNDRNRSILRSMLPVQRRYAAVFAGEGWTPLVPTLQADVYASLWQDSRLRLWTLVNRSERSIEGDLLEVDSHGPYFDLIAGTEIRGPVLSGRIEPRGIACFVTGDAGSGLSAFLASQARIDRRASFATVFPARTTALRAAAQATGPLPEDMVAIGPAEFDMHVEFRVRECGLYGPLPFSGPGGPSLHNMATFDRHIELARYAIDLTPVTNRQFARFLEAAGYRPRDAKNFLRHWRSLRPPEDKLDHPVVYIDLADARAYAAWAGKRLPTEEEWQYAAQGPYARRYPWGDELLPNYANTGKAGGTTPVTAFPAGRSPFGCYDMCGNTWEWTESERSDGRTRFAILRGGSFYRARGSAWYMDGGPQPTGFAAKMLLMWPGLDRCATVGFRCALSLSL